jgi:hypothetical protein
MGRGCDTLSDSSSWSSAKNMSFPMPYVQFSRDENLFVERNVSVAVDGVKNPRAQLWGTPEGFQQVGPLALAECGSLPGPCLLWCG